MHELPSGLHCPSRGSQPCAAGQTTFWHFRLIASLGMKSVAVVPDGATPSKTVAVTWQGAEAKGSVMWGAVKE
jgi:hypothetical protein